LEYIRPVLIAIITCVVGIVVENLKWPQDRSAIKQRFLDSDSAVEKTSLLVGLVLSHSVVRWLIAFAVAAVLVRVAFEAPGLREALANSARSGGLTYGRLDALTGLVISALMTALSLTARRLSTERVAPTKE